MNKPYSSLGLMSGTSMDGVDASIIQSDGEKEYKGLFDKFFETLAWAMCFGVMGSALLALLLIPSMFCFLGKVSD